MAASLTTSACWRVRNQKHYSAGSVCLFGLYCRLHEPGSADLPHPPPTAATRFYQPLRRLCLNHLEPGPQSSSPHSSCQPSDIYRSDGKRPDGTSIVPWKSGRVLVWDVTSPDTLAPSYAALATREAAAVAAEMEQRKREKYAHLDPSHFFVPIAVETLGATGPEAGHFFRDLGRPIAVTTSEPLSHQHLLQRVSVAIQRGNAAAILGTV